MENLNAIRQFKPGFEGATTSGNKYSVYGLKLKRRWTLLVVDSLSIKSFQLNRKTGELSDNTETYTDMIVTSMRAKMIKVKQKRKDLADFTLINYYRMSTKGLRLFQRINSTENKIKRLESQGKKAKGLLEKAKKIKK